MALDAGPGAPLETAVPTQHAAVEDRSGDAPGDVPGISMTRIVSVSTAPGKARGALRPWATDRASSAWPS